MEGSTSVLHAGQVITMPINALSAGLGVLFVVGGQYMICLCDFVVVYCISNPQT